MLKYTLYFMVAISLAICQVAAAQERHVVQVKVFDEQLKPFPGIELSLDGQEYISIGKSGSAFVEVTDDVLPPESVRVKNNLFEAASWNYSKGILQIIVRKKNYEVIEFVVQDANKNPVGDAEITFKGKTNVTTRISREGKFEIPLALDEKAIQPDQFTIANYTISSVVRSKSGNVLTIEPVQAAIPQTSAAEKPTPQREEYFRDFDLSQLDSIKSLTVFYAIFKNYHVSDLDDDVKQKLDAKLKTLVEALNDSVTLDVPGSFLGRISDSSFVSDDIRNLLAQATMENRALDENRDGFDEKIEVIREKLESGIGNLSAETREKLLSDLMILEQVLEENENKFYTNQSHYRLILNAINENFFNYENLEKRLSAVEAERLREQELFRKRLLTILGVAAIFAVFLVLLIAVRNKLKAQKRQLVFANDEIKRINENLETLVFERTRLLQEANRELDLFLYKASHDLKSPVCSIIGLGNLAAANPDNTDTRDLFTRVVERAHSMDRLLNKLRIISEINQPGQFSQLDLSGMFEGVRQHFVSFIRQNNIELSIDCPKELRLYSNKTLTEAILFYLLENALFFCTLKSSGTPKVKFTAREVNGFLEFSFYDNGIGIDTDIRERIFDMFYIGHERSTGNGLGLYIVAKSVHALKGNIRMDSEVNTYTRFVATIPMEFPKDAAVSEGTPSSERQIAVGDLGASLLLTGAGGPK